MLRNALLFFPEAGLVPAPAWLHGAIGLAAFALALLPILGFTRRGLVAPGPVAATSRRTAAERPGGVRRCTA